mmetsp:Transcript_12448/g.37429  ORF Transcript_12448/g.37429 Transcript_12448/m.37429 type:complete len:298 (+) Transcript_12448:235-1128(+)
MHSLSSHDRLAHRFARPADSNCPQKGPYWVLCLKVHAASDPRTPASRKASYIRTAAWASRAAYSSCAAVSGRDPQGLTCWSLSRGLPSSAEVMADSPLLMARLLALGPSCAIWWACQGERRSSTRGSTRMACSPRWVRAARVRSSATPTPTTSGGADPAAVCANGLKVASCGCCADGAAGAECWADAVGAPAWANSDAKVSPARTSELPADLLSAGVSFAWLVPGVACALVVSVVVSNGATATARVTSDAAVIVLQSLPWALVLCQGRGAAPRCGGHMGGRLPGAPASASSTLSPAD